MNLYNFSDENNWLRWLIKVYTKDKNFASMVHVCSLRFNPTLLLEKSCSVQYCQSTKPTQISSLFRSNTPDINFLRTTEFQSWKGSLKSQFNPLVIQVQKLRPKVINLPSTTLSYLTIIAEAFVSCWKAACKAFHSNDTVQTIKVDCIQVRTKPSDLGEDIFPLKHSLHLPTIVHLVQASISTQGNYWNYF